MDDRFARVNFVENQAMCDGFSVYFIDKIGKIANKVIDVIGGGTLPPFVQLAYLAPDNLSDFAPITDEDAIQAIRSVQ